MFFDVCFFRQNKAKKNTQYYLIRSATVSFICGWRVCLLARISAPLNKKQTSISRVITIRHDLTHS